METLKFVDLFAGLGGFHYGLADLGHECVFASEIDTELRGLYKRNFPTIAGSVYSDIRKAKESVPAHDVLCAGFPCQPFSKSGFQNGRRETRGNLFQEILDIAARRNPSYLILENVGNFERHAGGKNWRMLRTGLEGLGYDVRGTEHVASGGHGLISPHHLGYPHQRERFFALASLEGLPADPFPPADRGRVTKLESVVQSSDELSRLDEEETALTQRQTDCIDHWNAFIQAMPASEKLPSFPIWGDELWGRYPFEARTPWSSTVEELRKCLGPAKVPQGAKKNLVLAFLPSYARSAQLHFPRWKVRFIKQNRDWLSRVRRFLPAGWTTALRQFPASLRKFEWNCGGEERDLWLYVLQFRPSGLRTKRYTSSPSLVAMTVTQIPILGPEGRFITRTEGLRLQGFPDEHLLPVLRASAFKALGNAVHVGVVRDIASRIVRPQSAIQSPGYSSEIEPARNQAISMNE